MAMSDHSDHYAVLGISSSALQCEIRVAFKRLALSVHPDKGGSKEAFQRVLLAFETLSDPLMRAQHDTSLNQDKGRVLVAKRKPNRETSSSPRKVARTRSFVGARPAEDSKVPASSHVPSEERPRGCARGRTNIPEDEHKGKRETSHGKYHKPHRQGNGSCRLLARIFALMRRLTPKVRCQALEHKFTQKQRVALENFIVSLRKAPDSTTWDAVQPSPALELPVDSDSDESIRSADDHPVLPICNGVQTCGPRSDCDEEFEEDLANQSVGEDTGHMRGLCTHMANGKAWYSASLTSETLCLRSRRVLDLAVAVDFLIVLTAVARAISQYSAQGASDTLDLDCARVDEVLMESMKENNISTDSLGLSISVNITPKWKWIGRNLCTPMFRSIRCAMEARNAMAPFVCHRHGNTTRAEKLKRIQHFPMEWPRFRTCFMHIVTLRGVAQRGPGAKSDYWDRRLDSMASRSSVLRERHAMELEDKSYRSKRFEEPACEARGHTWEMRSMIAEDRRQHRVLRLEKSCERRCMRSMAVEDALSACWRGHASWEAVVLEALFQALSDWQRQEERQKQRALRLRRRREKANLQIAQQNKRIAARAERIIRDARWRWVSRTDLTMDELRAGEVGARM